MRPKLSIVIPTMNRREMLTQTLATIVPQLCAEAELVVLDSSKDAQPIKEMVEKGGGRYFWQEARGFDQAYLSVVELAQGEYVWLFGDDDLIKPHAVKEVLRLLDAPPLKAHESHTASKSSGDRVPLDLLIVNADVVANETSQILKPRWLDMPETEYGVAERSEVVAKLGDLMTFMGSIIVRKEFWSQSAAVAGSYIGKRFMTMIVPLLLPARRVRYAPMVMASARFGHQCWFDTVSTLIGKTMTEVVWSLPDVADYAKQACAPRPPSWHMVLLWRACGQPIGALPYFRTRVIGAIPVPAMRWFCRMIVRVTGKTQSMTGYTLGFPLRGSTAAH